MNWINSKITNPNCSFFSILALLYRGPGAHAEALPAALQKRSCRRTHRSARDSIVSIDLACRGQRRIILPSISRSSSGIRPFAQLANYAFLPAIVSRRPALLHAQTEAAWCVCVCLLLHGGMLQRLGGQIDLTQRLSGYWLRDQRD